LDGIDGDSCKLDLGHSLRIAGNIHWIRLEILINPIRSPSRYLGVLAELLEVFYLMMGQGLLLNPDDPPIVFLCLF